MFTVTQADGEVRRKPLPRLCPTLLQPQEACAQSREQVWPRSPGLRCPVCPLPPSPPGNLHRVDQQGMCNQSLELHFLWDCGGRKD